MKSFHLFLTLLFAFVALSGAREEKAVILSSTPDYAHCCCHSIPEMLFPYSDPTYGVNLTRDISLPLSPVMIQGFRHALAERMREATEKTVATPCKEQQTQGYPVTIQGQHLPVFKSLDEVKAALRIADDEKPDGDPDAEVLALQGSTQDFLKIRIGILRCDPGRKAITLTGVEGKGSITFLKVICVTPGSPVRHTTFNGIRLVGSREPIDITVIADGLISMPAPPFFQRLNLTPVAVASLKECTVRTTGGERNIATYLNRAGDIPRNVSKNLFFRRPRRST